MLLIDDQVPSGQIALMVEMVVEMVPVAELPLPATAWGLANESVKSVASSIRVKMKTISPKNLIFG